MRHRASILSCACALSIACHAGAVSAQGQGDDRRESYARLADLPPLDGVWQIIWGAWSTVEAGEPNAPLTSEARAVYEEFQAGKERGENLQTIGANCLPSGVPRSMRAPYPIEFIYSPEKVTLLIETGNYIRQIFTDGRPLPDDPEPFFMGNSIGHWEGDDLVIETVGLSERISLLEGIHPTPQTRVKETVHLTGPDAMVLRTEITDPALFTAPYVFEIPFERRPGWSIREYVCQENNRDAADEFGRPSMDLGWDEE